MKTFLAIVGVIAILCWLDVGSLFHTVTGHWHLDLDFGVFDFVEGLIGVAILVAMALVVAAFFTIGVLGVVCVVLALAAIGLLLAGVATLWPVLLLGLVIWLLVKEDKDVQEWS